MLEICLEGLPSQVEEAVIKQWFSEEGDAVRKGDDLVELETPQGNITIQASSDGILAEACFDEGESVGQGEVLCVIDDQENSLDDSAFEE